MSRLLCLVGIHRPVLPGEWNLGYCFSTCRGCGRDMVRSVLDGWKAPNAFRVIRGDAPTAYQDLDAFLRAREAPRPQTYMIDMGGQAHNPPAVATVSERRQPPAPSAGTPFDFSDFEPNSPGAAPPPLKTSRSVSV